MLPVLIGFFAFLYIVAPIIVLFTQKQAAHPKLHFYGKIIDDPRFQHLTSTAAALQSAGFELIGYFGHLGQTTNVNAFIAYLIHRANGDTGIAVMVATKAGKTVSVVEFTTRFTDQSSVTTGNSATPSVYVRPRNKPTFHFPAITDPVRLYRLHQRLVAWDHSGQPKDVPPPGTEQARIEDGMRREMADQLATGILRLDGTGSFYKPTVWGAYRMTWRLLFPGKQLLVLTRRYRASRLARALESEQPYPQAIHNV